MKVSKKISNTTHKMSDLTHKATHPSQWSHWWTVVIIITVLATIFLSVGMAANLLSVTHPLTSATYKDSLANFIKEWNNIPLNPHADLFYIAKHKADIDQAFPSLSGLGTALGLALTGFSLFIIDAALIVVAIVKEVMKRTHSHNHNK